jgi:hypothetical protein
MIIINILSLPFRFRLLVSHDRDPYAIKVVYNHTRIASYRRWRRKARMGLLALDGRNAELAGGFPSNLFCPVHAEQFVSFMDSPFHASVKSYLMHLTSVADP